MIKEMMLIGTLAFSNDVSVPPVEDNTTTSIVEEDPSKEEIENVLKEWFSPEVIATIMSWVTYLGTIIGLVVSLKRLKAKNNLTLESVQDVIVKSLEGQISDDVKKELDKFLPEMLLTLQKTNDINKVLTKVLALSQENTPESRVAILNVISELGVVDNKTLDIAKANIEDEVKTKAVKKEEKLKAVEKIESETKIDDGTTL